MIEKLRSLSLRKLLVILFSVSIFLVLVTQLFYCISIFKRNFDQNKETSDNIIIQTDAKLTIVSERISSIGKTVSNNAFVQELLHLNSIDKRGYLKRRMELNDMVHNFLKGIISANEELYDIVLIDNVESIISSSSEFKYFLYNQIKQTYLDKFDEDYFTSDFTFNLNGLEKSGFGYVIPIYYTAGNYNISSQRLGTCIVWYKDSVLNEIVKNTAVNNESTVLITDSTGNILAVNSNYKIEELRKEIDPMFASYNKAENQNSIQEISFMEQKALMLIKDHEFTGWKSINIVPFNSIYKGTLNTLYLGMTLAVVSIAILLSFGIFMILSITRPLKHITSVLDTIGCGKRKQRIEIINKNEFGIISESINTMLDNVENMNFRIFDMQSKLYEKELLQKEAEMLALQSQINPHFLYNTLECIRSIAIINKIPEISTISISMSRIFRYSIKGGLITTVKGELECVNDYYKIIAVRYGGRLKLELQVDEALYPYTALKMFMQPIIENSVNHGLEATEGDVLINIKGSITDDYGVFVIQDNGIGMEPEQVERLNTNFRKSPKEDISEISKSKSSIGLSNINMRIKMHYGEECGLHVQSKKNVGTIVTVKFRLLAAHEIGIGKE